MDWFETLALHYQRIALLGRSRIVRQSCPAELSGRACVTARCRPGCGACCIAPSISSPIPGMPNGKPAGVRCVQLNQDNGCALFNDPRRPAFCRSLQPGQEMCGDSRTHALNYLEALELQTGH